MMLCKEKVIMKQYLLDSNICAFLFRNKYGVGAKLLQVGTAACCVSDITIAELKYGACKSGRLAENMQLIDNLTTAIDVLSFTKATEVFAFTKNELRQKGLLVEDFDVAIASIAMFYGLTLVTDNTKHFQNINGLKIENWVER